MDLFPYKFQNWMIKRENKKKDICCKSPTEILVMLSLKTCSQTDQLPLISSCPVTVLTVEPYL